jgi:hydrogenase expression/formation protein HypD
MKYIDEFRSKNLIGKLSRKIKAVIGVSNINIMEVCGTHTQNFFRFGLDKTLPSNLKLISGPGCPVCVSSQDYIDKAMLYAKDKNVIIVTFGDMLRVPGSSSTLEKERAKGAHVVVAYSALDSLKIARQNPSKKVIFLAVGFETTAPTVALTVLLAKKDNVKNLFFYSSLKLIPPAMDHLVKDKRLNLSGFMCPGHVSAIIGTKPYEFIPKRYKIGCCVAGFEPLDILEGIYLLLQQIIKNKPVVANQYSRVVNPEGNTVAQKIIYNVFEVCNAYWRGIGEVPKSGLKIKQKFSLLDIEQAFPLKLKQKKDTKDKPCRCGDVLKGLIEPSQCSLFSKICNPRNPLGPCMVSSEGACNAYYKYH